jgi:PilZ domain
MAPWAVHYNRRIDKKDLMRQQLKITIFLGATLLAAVLLKILYFPNLKGQSAYYFLSVFWICGILAALLSLNLIWSRSSGARPTASAPCHTDRVNRRNTFRIIYPVLVRPTLVVEAADDNPIRNLEYPVVDLSQGGSCFLDDGSLGDMQRLSGHIRLNNGDRIRIAGKLIRKKGNQVSVQFVNPIAWSTLLQEQRRVLAQMKAAR